MTMIELSHALAHGTQTFPGFLPPEIRHHISFDESRSQIVEGRQFAIDLITLVGGSGTYMDAPHHFDPDGTDISESAVPSAERSSPREVLPPTAFVFTGLLALPAFLTHGSRVVLAGGALTAAIIGFTLTLLIGFKDPADPTPATGTRPRRAVSEAVTESGRFRAGSVCSASRVADRNSPGEGPALDESERSLVDPILICFLGLKMSDASQLCGEHQDIESVVVLTTERQEIRIRIAP